jgi:tetratricopeptide (TPR) repeat protein
MKTSPIGMLIAATAALCLPVMTSGQTTRAQPLAAGSIDTTGAIYVHVQDVSGGALSIRPHVTLTTGMADGPTIGEADQWSSSEFIFHNLQVGSQYVVQVEAKGYQTAQQYVTLGLYNDASANITIYMRPVGPGSSPAPAPAGFLLAPEAQREVEHAIHDLKSNKIGSAQQHLNRALKLAPGNPGVNYLLGLSYLRANQLAAAVPYLEKSVSLDPNDVPALLALGTVRYQQGDYAGAVKALSTAVDRNPSSWQGHWILASAYLREKDYQQARDHAESALKAGGKQAGHAQLVLGEALAGLGMREEALAAFEAFLKKNPHDPVGEQVRAAMEALRSPPAAPAPVHASANASPAPAVAAPAKTAPVSVSPPHAAPDTSVAVAPVTRSPAAAPPALPSKALLTATTPVKANWVPPDVDDVTPELVAGPACNLPVLLKNAAKRASQWVQDLQEFSATEEYQSVEIHHDGTLGSPVAHTSRYLLFVRNLRPHLFTMDELREPKLSIAEMSAGAVNLGSPALGLIFHPDFQGDFDWQCEGLTNWKGEPAWVVRFRQKPSRPTSRLLAFDTFSQEYLVALRGIAWLSEKGDQVMHLESDLANPMVPLRLDRQHFSIDYRLVSFHTHPVQLWLPENVDLYIEYQGHVYHNYSHYSDFQLFWTGTGQKIGKPAAATRP